ncbi:MAG TPA: group I intron-associated PD-(D/E)XK endonuclease [Candidatus Acidoferrum sp.]|nr:group I intron-associated PD-(D/E)XK endonuclease [Candidatus Acidoferrum sp.]
MGTVVSFFREPSLFEGNRPATRPRNTKHIGDVSEMIVAAALTLAGYDVLKPLGESVRYDLVIDDGEKFFRVQVKTGRLRRGVIRFNTCSTHGHRGKPSRPYFGQVEFIAVYCPDTGKVYLVPESDLTRVHGSLRVAATLNNAQKGVRWAVDYELRE